MSAASSTEASAMVRQPLVLVSHALCPYVQRVAIALHEKGLAFERRDVDLAHKPAWFLALSPLGRTPVLLAQGQALFESAVICDYLDEAHAPRLHLETALQKARERGWVEFASAVLQSIAVLYNAADEAALEAARQALRARFEHVEAALGQGPYFAGSRFGMVDVAFAPVFRYFDVFDQAGEAALLQGLPRIAAWRLALAQRASVRAAAAGDYTERLEDFLVRRPSALGRRMAAKRGGTVIARAEVV